jgi:hypothetical protein
MCLDRKWSKHNMHMETKFLRLRTPVGLGSRSVAWRFANVDFSCFPTPPEGLMCHAVTTAKEKI